MSVDHTNHLIGTGTIYQINWSWGQDNELAFDPSRDVLDFGWFSGNDFTLTEVNGSIVISIPSNQQSYTLTGVRFTDLTSQNILTSDSQATEQWNQALNTATTLETDVETPTPEIDDSPDSAGGFKVTWAWNQHTVVSFDPQTDTIDFGWFAADNFSVNEIDGSVVITVDSNQQSYTLQGVKLSDLSADNIVALESGTLSKWQQLLNQASEEPIDESEDVSPPLVDTDDSTTPPEPEPEPEHNGAEGDTPSGAASPIISAYFPEWAIYGRDFNVADIPAANLTHLIYAFAKIDDAGRMSLFDSYAAVEKTFQAGDSVAGVADTWDQSLAGNFNQLAQLKDVNPDLKNLIAVGGWTLSGPFSDVASTAEGRENFADSAVQFLQTYPMFDGIDFDWEYPGGGGLDSNTIRPEDGQNYALLLEVVRARLDDLENETGREYQIAVASPAGSDKIANFNLAGLEPYVDFFNLMAYDFHGGWENITGHQAPMFDTIGGDYDVVTAVNLYKEAGIDGSKIVLGAPAYTRAWAGVENNGNGGWQEVTNQLAPGSFEQGVYDYKDIVNKVLDPNQDWSIYWDDDAQAAYVFSESEGIYSTFETPTSIALKSEWAQSEGLGGMMFWDLSGDVSQGPESLTSAAWRSWFGGETVEQISLTSALQAEFVIGGNGKMDSFVDYVYEPNISIPEADDRSVEPVEPADDPLTDINQGEIFSIQWSWGANQNLDFDPQFDKLDFGWIDGSAFELSEQDGSVIVSIASNLQTYTLQDVTARDLSLENIQALDESTTTQWASFLG